MVAGKLGADVSVEQGSGGDEKVCAAGAFGAPGRSGIAGPRGGDRHALYDLELDHTARMDAGVGGKIDSGASVDYQAFVLLPGQ